MSKTLQEQDRIHRAGQASLVEHMLDELAEIFTEYQHEARELLTTYQARTTEPARIGYCEGCRFWGHPLSGGEMATCTLLTHNSSPFFSDTARVYLRERDAAFSARGSPFRTNRRFGCTEFKAQEAGTVQDV